MDDFFFFLWKLTVCSFIRYITCICKYMTPFLYGPKQLRSHKSCHRSGGTTWIQMAITDERKMRQIWFYSYVIADKRTFNSLYDMTRIPFCIALIFASERLWTSKGCNSDSKWETLRMHFARVRKTSIFPERQRLESKFFFHSEVHKMSFHLLSVCPLHLKHSVCCEASKRWVFPL